MPEQRHLSAVCAAKHVSDSGASCWRTMADAMIGYNLSDELQDKIQPMIEFHRQERENLSACGRAAGGLDLLSTEDSCVFDMPP